MAVLSSWQLPVFRDLRLEDSSLLRVREKPAELRLDVEFVLTERHPSFRPPAPGQKHCYVEGRILFRGVTELRWTHRQTDVQEVEGGASLDLGIFEEFLLDGSIYKFRGRFGQVEVRAGSVDVSL